MAPRNPAARTAYGPMVIAAAEHARPAGARLHDDPLAIRMLPTGQRLIARGCAWDAAYRMLAAATDARAEGLWAEVLCRKQYADDQVAAAIDAGIRQFVFLGAAPARRDFVTRRRVWRFGLDPAEVPTFLTRYGWALREQVGADEYTDRYLTPAGRDLPISHIERFVLAERDDTPPEPR